MTDTPTPRRTAASRFAAVETDVAAAARSLEHIPHPHLAARRQQGAPTVAKAVADHPSLNLRLAAWGTRKFGSMPAFYLFVIYGALGAVFGSVQGTLLYWSNWIQLWSLPLLMVGGIVLGMAHDRAAKQQFDDTEAILHYADGHARSLAELHAKVDTGLARIHSRLDTELAMAAARMRPTAPTPAAPPAPAPPSTPSSPLADGSTGSASTS